MLIHWGFATPHIDQSTEQQPLRNDRVGFSLSTCDKSSNGTNQTLLLKPLVCKPGTSIVQTMWQAHINTLIPSRWMNILAVDGRGGNSKVLSNCHVPHTCVFDLCLGFVWRLSDKWRSQGDRIHLSDRWCHCCRLQSLRAWCVRNVRVCVCFCLFSCMCMSVCVCECMWEWERERERWGGVVESMLYICLSENYWVFLQVCAKKQFHMFMYALE